MIISYIVPFLYTHRYNRRGLEGIAYFLEYYMALLLFVYLNLSSYIDILTYVISLISFMLVYEVGYIENNILAIAKDDQPTIRHTKSEEKFLQKRYKRIFRYRYIMIGALLLLLSYYIPVTTLLILLILLILTRYFYYLYNMKFRKGFRNRLLFTVLRFLRILTPIAFIGLNAVILAFFIAFVNFINNLSWYHRTQFYLPRFFGTKLFDSLTYGAFYYLFQMYDYPDISLAFLYLSLIKLGLFTIVIIKRNGNQNV